MPRSENRIWQGKCNDGIGGFSQALAYRVFILGYTPVAGQYITGIASVNEGYVYLDLLPEYHATTGRWRVPVGS